MYTPKADLSADELPIGLKLVHINKCPVVAPAKTLLPENAARLGIDREQCLKNLANLKADSALRQKVIDVFSEQRDFGETTNPDYQLYNGFTSRNDKQLLDVIHETKPEHLGNLQLDFEDKKFETLFFRYRARNWPETLEAHELDTWRTYCKDKIMNGEDQPSIDAQDFMLTLENLVHEHDGDDKKLTILKSLYHYAQNL